MSRKKTDSEDGFISDEYEIDEYEYSQEVVDDFEELLDDEEYDAIIYVGEKENINEIHAHSLILRTRSQYFRRIFSNKSAKKENGKFIFKLPDISRPNFEIILRFIYCGKIDLPTKSSPRFSNLQSSGILKLLMAVEELNIQTLIPCIQEYYIKHQDEFLQQNEKLLETCEGYDIVIYAGQNENGKAIHAHSFILRTRSQYFRKKFSKENIVKKDGKFILKMSNISPHLLTIILKHIYCDKIELTNLQNHDVLKLLIAITELNIEPLIPCIQKYLIDNQHKFLQHSVEILETVCQHESFTDLRNIYLESICGEPKLLFDSDKFINLSAPLLELILKRDDLFLNEIVVWDNLMKWSLAQHSNISQDVKKWNKEDFTIMERTIHRFIPLIRLFHIAPKDFLSKVYPFKGLLPEDLTINILTSHMVSNEELNINIQPPRQRVKHFPIFASWIEKKNDSHYNVDNIPYSFNLLYRASRDGNTSAAFHAKCDNKGATIVVAKITNTEQIFGGYSPLFWDSSSGYKSTNDSFIFFFTDRNNFKSAKVGYGNGQNSIYCLSGYGPTFGSGHDLYCGNDGAWSCNNPYSYTQLDGLPKGQFNVDDYEVFQVIKK